MSPLFHALALAAAEPRSITLTPDECMQLSTEHRATELALAEAQTRAQELAAEIIKETKK